MLSPGEFYRSIPKEPRANIAWRLRLLEATKEKPALAEGWKEMCRQDILFYINAFVWQSNPREIDRGETGPFITWGFQDDAIRTILRSVYCTCSDKDKPHQHDLLIEKSREMGASWLCLIVMEWIWHFHPRKKFLCISRSEAAVEDDDPDSLFWKIDFIHRHLPDWLLPRMKRLHKAGGYFGNLDNESTITGQASTGRAGVGGRATAMFIDEFSQIKEDFEVLDRTSDTTGCRIFNGTHKGTSTAFFELSQRVDMHKLQMHWTQHPGKNGGLYQFVKGKIEVLDKQFHYPTDFQFVMTEAPAGGPRPGVRSPWYDVECGRKTGPYAVAMDLDIDSGGSVSQFFDPLKLKDYISHHARPPLWTGDIEYDPDTAKPIRLHQDEKGPLKLWVIPKLDGTFPHDRYGAGADLAQGTGATNSCLSIGRGSTGEKVAEYAVPDVYPERMALIAVAVCSLFTDEHGTPTLFCWEHAGPGIIFGKCVIDLHYPRIYYRESDMRTMGVKKSMIPGWYPQNDQKRLLLDEYRKAMYERRVLNRSKLALEECFYFLNTTQGTIEHSKEQSTQDPSGARSNHGDRVIADALMWKMINGLAQKIAKAKAEEIPEGCLAHRRLIRENERESSDPWAWQGSSLWQ